MRRPSFYCKRPLFIAAVINTNTSVHATSFILSPAPRRPKDQKHREGHISPSSRGKLHYPPATLSTSDHFLSKIFFPVQKVTKDFPLPNSKHRNTFLISLYYGVLRTALRWVYSVEYIVHTKINSQKRQLCALVCVRVLIPYILVPVYAFRCMFDVSAGVWKEENEHNILTCFCFWNRTNDCRTVPHDNEELSPHPRYRPISQPLSSLYIANRLSLTSTTRLALCFFVFFCRRNDSHFYVFFLLC